MDADSGQGRENVNLLIRFIDKMNRWIGRIVSYLVIVMILTIMYEVIARYFFGSPTLWVTELNIYVLCGYILLAGGATLADNGHVRVDIFWGTLSTRNKALTDIITSGLLFAFCLALVWKGGEMAIRSFVNSAASAEAMGWPLYPSQFMVPLGGFLLLLQGLAKLWRDILIFRNGGK